jgi:hypothetical protein
VGKVRGGGAARGTPAIMALHRVLIVRRRPIRHRHRRARPRCVHRRLRVPLDATALARIGVQAE